jgi:hypothetical protein
MGHPAAEYRRHPPSGCSDRLGAARRRPESQRAAEAAEAAAAAAALADSR